MAEQKEHYSAEWTAVYWVERSETTMDGTSAAMSVASTAGSMVASSVVRWD